MQTRKAHNFKIGYIVSYIHRTYIAYIAKLENNKLDSKYKDTRYVILRNPSDKSFELVNTENGTLVIRNVKHIRRVPLPVDFDILEPVTQNLDLNIDMNMRAPKDAPLPQHLPAVETPQETVMLPEPKATEGTTRSGRVIKKPACYR